jgi:hypothetical protein
MLEEFAEKYEIGDDVLSFMREILDRTTPITIETVFNQSYDRLMEEVNRYTNIAKNQMGNGNSEVQIDNMSFSGSTSKGGSKKLSYRFDERDSLIGIGTMVDTCNGYDLYISKNNVDRIEFDVDGPIDEICFSFKDQKVVSIQGVDTNDCIELNGPYALYGKDYLLKTLDYYHDGKKVAEFYSENKSKLYYKDAFKYGESTIFTNTKVYDV